jgi:signal transduction histidine kinase
MLRVCYPGWSDRVDVSDQPIVMQKGAKPLPRAGAGAAARAGVGVGPVSPGRTERLGGFPTTRRGALVIAGIAILFLPVASFITAPSILQDSGSYLSVHTLLEMFAVMVSTMIAGIGWNAIHGRRSGHMVVAAAGFGAVAVLDLAHLLSFGGMPDFVTPSGAEKAILFWLAARYATAVVLLIVVLAPGRWPAGRSLRLWSAGIAAGYAGLVCWLVLGHQDWLPRTFIAGVGLTPLKVAAEYGVIGLLVAAAVTLWFKPPADFAFRGPPLLAGLLLLVASEAALTLYISVHDIYNFVGHLYKVAGTYLLYRAVFVDAVQWPYHNLRASEEEHRLLLEQAADSILRIGEDRRIIDANQRAQVMTGLDRDALVGRRIEDLVTGWVDPGAVAPGAAASEIALWQSRMHRLGAAGPATDMVVEVSARRLAHGEVQAIIRDVSERKAAEDRLRSALSIAEQTTQAKSAFLANMSHELRTPLNAVLGFSELIERQMIGPLGDARYVAYAADIHKAGAHLLTIINDILDLARVESGRFELHEDSFVLQPLITECLRMVRPSAAHLSLEAETPEGLALHADSRALRQVLLNLLSNAIKFTRADGRVRVVSRLRPDGALEIAVSDTGIGIAEADLPHVTEAFVQVESAYARKHAGSGLGLAISKALVELHGGTLSLASRLGEGTTVTVTLPRQRVIAAG